MQSDKLRYLIAGAWNTFFGYSLGVLLFLALTEKLNTAIIALIANFFAILMAFTTYKLFIFRSKGNWRREFIRACTVYGNMALASIGLIWFLVDILKLNIWLSQALTLVLTVFISYFLHKRFTFRQR